MKNPEHEHYPDPHHDLYAKTTFGFWIYLLTDFVLFGTLFASYAVLRTSTYGGPGPSELFNVPFKLAPTFVLLLASLTVGLGSAFAHRKNRKGTLIFYTITFLLGIGFLVMELSDLSGLLQKGHSWKNSAFLSAYFTLVGTHFAHMVFALLWIIVLMPPVITEGITAMSLRRLTCLKMFWQFLNIIWMFIFSFVYLWEGAI